VSSRACTSKTKRMYATLQHFPRRLSFFVRMHAFDQRAVLCRALQGVAQMSSDCVLGLCTCQAKLNSTHGPPRSSGTMEQQPGSTQTTYMKVRSNANHLRLFRTQQTTKIVHGDLDAISAELRSLITVCPNCARLAGAADIK
jgi:hypothetical protein